MPAYVFRCDKCDIEEERQFSIHDAPAMVDGSCGHQTRRVVRWSGGTVLRGKGWAKHPDRDTAVFKKGPQ